MPKSNRLLFLLADGTHARLIERSTFGDFATFQEIDGAGELNTVRALMRQDPPGRGFESYGTARHAVGQEDPYRSTKLAFADSVAAEAQKQARAHGADGVVLVAPARLLPVMKRRSAGGIKVVATLAKDLTKTPDEDLERWLSPLEASARRGGGVETRAGR
jgi:protein required for attachment to host cells